MGRLKRKVSNRAQVEASVSEAVVIEEIVSYVEKYFRNDVQTRYNRVGRNDDGGDVDDDGRLSVFTLPGRFLGKSKKRMLSFKEFAAAKIYVLLNCVEVDDYLK